MKRIVVFWMLASIAYAAHATLTAEVDATTISAADTVRLTLRADGANVAGSPDIEALQTDFDILNTQSSSQFRSINGHVDAWTAWTLVLKPKRSGTLQIPALHLGNEQSAPISITVRELDPQLRHAIGETVFFETTVAPERVYVQSQFVVTRRLFYANGAQLYGEMPEIPEIPGALVRPLGEPAHSSAMRDGRQFGVLEQRFAVFPERSGTLSIPRATVSGSVRLPTDGGGRRIGVDIASEPLAIEVQPIPTEYPHTAPWLPAAQVELLEDWPGQPEQALAVGASSQRTLMVRVDGNTASAIPPLVAGLPASFKAYPQAPGLNDVVTASGIVGTRTETTSLVATQPGDVEFPQVELTWWDTVNHRVRTASLGPHRITVTGTATATAEPSREQTAAPSADAHVERQVSDPAASAAAAAGAPKTDRSAVWLAVVIVCVAALVAIGWSARRRLAKFMSRAAPGDRKHAEASAYRVFKRACSSGNAQRTRAALDAWLSAHYAMRLRDAAARFTSDAAARTAVGALNARLYQRDHDTPFDTAALRACVDACRKTRARMPRSDALPALYPSA